MSVSAPTTAFVDADIVLDPNQLVNDALDQLNASLEAAGMPGWTPQDDDLLVIFLNTVAQIAADLNTTASTVLPGIFRQFGTQLLNLPYQTGTAASVTSTWTFTSPAPSGGYQIQAGTPVSIDAQPFYVQNATSVPAGSTTATVTLVASQTGSAYNGLGGINAGYPTVQLSNEIDWVAGITTASVTSGGADQEDDDDYEDRLASVLQLMAPRPIVASDFATYVLSDYVANTTGVTVGRATAIDGFYPAARSLSTGGTGPAPLTATGSLTSGSPTVSITADPFYGAVPYPGASVTGSGTPASTMVLASPAPSTSSFTMSGSATGSATGETITVGEWSNVTGVSTVFVADENGNALSASAMDAIESYLSTLIQQNAQVYVERPSYNTIYINAEVHVLPAYVGSEANVTGNVQAALTSYLSPATWGNLSNQGGVSQWLNSGQGFNVVRFNSLVQQIENVPGVQYLLPGTLTIGFSASPTGTTDLVMTGPAPLPMVGALNISTDN